MIEAPQQSAAQQQVQVRIVDCDVHPEPRPGEILERIAEPWRSGYFARRQTPYAVCYDSPDIAHNWSMRADSYPPDGGFAGSDPDFAFQQLIVEAGVDIGILEPLGGGTPDMEPEAGSASKHAYNVWQDETWLGPQNRSGRWRGSIMVNIHDPKGAAREIEEWAGHPLMVQVLLSGERRPAWGDPFYNPIWEAATRHGLPICCHLGRGRFESYPMSPVGFQSYNHDFMTGYSLLAANQVLSLVFDGVLERFPTLKICFTEFAFNWIQPLMWRMDKVWEARRGDVPEVKRRPSEYVYDNIRFTTQPLDYPDDISQMTRALEWMQADRILYFSSDYPHWTFDDPKWVKPHLPQAMRDRILFENAIEDFNLPRTIPALTQRPHAAS